MANNNGDHLKDQFSKLIKLIIHGETELARDLVYDIQDLVLNSNTYISTHQETTNTITPSMVTPSAYFKFSLNVEKCSFCAGLIPRRVSGQGMFITRDYKYKWCEGCATEKHKQHPFYIKAHKDKGAK